ncbi:hypothetical protein KSP40_PGU010724 [Platanthera guangdongensis]|uniref:Uncharacterized protein n=1 Tax=Platanthera guangdongensis TaxID=2320717 RepID=A0ABR2N4V5_9ASPA
MKTANTPDAHDPRECRKLDCNPTNGRTRLVRTFNVNLRRSTATTATTEEKTPIGPLPSSISSFGNRERRELEQVRRRELQKQRQPGTTKAQAISTQRYADSSATAEPRRAPVRTQKAVKSSLLPSSSPLQASLNPSSHREFGYLISGSPLSLVGAIIGFLCSQELISFS